MLHLRRFMKRERACGRRGWLVVGMLVPMIAAVPAGTQPQDTRLVQQGEIEIQAARFWRGQGTTLVEGLISVSAARVPVRRARTVTLTIRDADGAELHREEWVDSVGAAGTEEVVTATPFAVALPPGTYSVGVQTAEPTGVVSAEVTVRSFEVSPLLSDLLLSTSIRLAGADDVLQPGELRKGPYAITRAPDVALLPTGAQLWHYVEVYAAQDTLPVTLRLAVYPAEGDQPLVQMETVVEVGAEGSPHAARVDLTGLPPGSYRFEIGAAGGTDSDRRSAAFEVLPFDARPARTVVAVPAAEEELIRRYFSSEVRSDSAIAVLIEALSHAPPASSIPRYARELTPDAQRRFLARYWARLAPRSGAPQHALLEEYLARLDFANRNYGERQIGVPGMRTDRGRIYLKYGSPDMRQLLPMTHNRAVEMWRYTQHRNLKFVFYDETGFSHYTLLMSNDPQEPGHPGWAERLGERELIDQIVKF